MEKIKSSKEETDVRQLSASAQKGVKAGFLPIVLAAAAAGLLLTSCQCADEINNGCTNEQCGK